MKTITPQREVWELVRSHPTEACVRLTQGDQCLVVAPHHVLVELLLPVLQLAPLLIRKTQGHIIKGQRCLKPVSHLLTHTLSGIDPQAPKSYLGDLALATRGQPKNPEVPVS